MYKTTPNVEFTASAWRGIAANKVELHYMVQDLSCCKMGEQKIASLDKILHALFYCLLFQQVLELN